MRGKIDPALKLAGIVRKIKSEPLKPSCISGAYVIAAQSGRRLQVVVGVGEDDYPWEHVSVSVVGGLRSDTPWWGEMCEVKDMFWHEHEAVVQYHPPKSENISLGEILHLWRPWADDIPMPPQVMV